jgi:hypothetical protein
MIASGHTAGAQDMTITAVDMDSTGNAKVTPVGACMAGHQVAMPREPVRDFAQMIGFA